MEFYNDPFATMFDAFEQIFPDARVEVGWVAPNEINQAKGCCSWAADGKGLIAIDITLPVIGAVDILCHELAHAVACEGCPDEGGDHHCEDWMAAYEAIRERYIKLVNESGNSREVEIPEPWTPAAYEIKKAGEMGIRLQRRYKDGGADRPDEIYWMAWLQSNPALGVAVDNWADVEAFAQSHRSCNTK